MSYKNFANDTKDGPDCEFPNFYRFRLSPELATIETAGLASSCPDRMSNTVYPRTIGMLPRYGGHVPGAVFRVGETFGNSTIDAKRWLALHKE